MAELPFEDNFDRKKLGDTWYNTGGQWMIDSNNAFTTGGNQAPLFLRINLPADVVIEIDVMSETTTVDCKVEIMTDGRTHSSGYVFIFGGWTNSISAIARLDEHGNDRRTKSPTGAQAKKWYRWRIEKKGGEIKWFVDGQPYLTFNDPEPLSGPGHNRFALSNWQNRIRYDNLKIWPYDKAPKRN